MRGHERFEALAGAILLGEAGESERAEYLNHARDCLRCDADVDGTRTEVLTAFAVAREMETWRPDTREAVARRIERGRGAQQRLTANALGCAIVLSIVLNAAVASGTAQRAVSALRPVVARLVPFAPVVADRPR
jgi:hypothetical protein